MCSGSWNSKKHPVFLVLKQQQQKQPHVSVAIRRKRLRLRRRAGAAEPMEMLNLKLYLENRCIIAENERLQERASALRRENLALRKDLYKAAADDLPAARAGGAV